jgi:hypothetical protein
MKVIICDGHPDSNENAFQRYLSELSDELGFDPRILRNLAPRDRLSKGRLSTYKALDKSGLANFHWDSQLKNNKAYDARFARPFDS